MDTDELIKQLLIKVLRFVTIRDRSEKEIVNYLNRKTDAETAEQVMEKVRRMGFIDEEKFAFAWVRSKLRKGKGQRVARIELKAKGISQTLANKAIQAIEVDEWRLCAATQLSKKWSVWQKLPAWQQKARGVQFLMMRGFDEITIRSVIDGMGGEAVQ